MKREARVLVSKCSGQLCVGIVIRLNSIDGLAISFESCEGLCRRLGHKGFLDEIRYYIGDCGCGLALMPGRQEVLGWAVAFAEDIANSLARARGLLGE
ncbi:hypothetical protein [Acidilobus sp.]|uniref:hypothetical protein n=1 Tax=Acidilobus sp. TaxID=1872109 RepID=UPI003CFEFEEB